VQIASSNSSQAARASSSVPQHQVQIASSNSSQAVPTPASVEANALTVEIDDDGYEWYLDTANFAVSAREVRVADNDDDNDIVNDSFEPIVPARLSSRATKGKAHTELDLAQYAGAKKSRISKH
jgi:hypothetical protein